jgi:hypothetical protein
MMAEKRILSFRYDGNLKNHKLTLFLKNIKIVVILKNNVHVKKEDFLGVYIQKVKRKIFLGLFYKK